MSDKEEYFINRSFNTVIAKDVGLYCAVLFEYIWGWITTNSRKDNATQLTTYRDGCYWMYTTYEAIHKELPYIAKSSVSTYIKKLVDAGYLIKAEHGKKNGDRSSWYAKGPVGSNPSPSQKALDAVKLEYAKWRSRVLENQGCHNGFSYDSIQVNEHMTSNQPDEAKASNDNSLHSLSSDSDLEVPITPKEEKELLINTNNNSYETNIEIPSKEKETNNIIPTEINTLKGIPNSDFEDLRTTLLDWCGARKIPNTGGGTKHKFNADQKGEQNVTIMAIHKLMEDYSESIEDFFLKRIDSLNTSWANRNNINYETIKEALANHRKKYPTHTNKEIIGFYAKEHMRVLLNKVDKEDMAKPPKSFKAFLFLETSKRDVGMHWKSWFLYWLVKPLAKEKTEEKKNEELILLEFKYPEKKLFYKQIDGLFGVNRILEGKTPKQLQNESTLLADEIIGRLVKKPKEIYIPNYMGSLVPGYFIEFFETVPENMKKKPTVFMPGRKSWNNFIDFLLKKSENPGLAEKYNQLKEFIEDSY